MKGPPSDAPSKALGRLAGLLYLAIILGAGFAEGYVRGTLVVPGDAAATADNIRSSPWLFRVGFVADLLAFLSDVGLAVLLYLLLEHVSRAWSLVAAAFRMAQATILGLNLLNHLTALLLLTGSVYVAAFEPEPLEALALLALERHELGYLISQTFFGVHCMLLGRLLYVSTYFPRLLGGLMAVAGLGYLADAMTFFLRPDLGPILSPGYLAPAVIGEVSLCIWLLAKGVRDSPTP